MLESPDDTRHRASSEFRTHLGLPDRTGRALLARYFDDRHCGLIGHAIIATFQSLLVLPTLWLFARVFDSAIPRRDVLLLVEIAAAIVAIRAVSSAIAIMFRLHVVRIIKGAITRLREDLLAGIYRMSYPQLNGSDLDRLQSRIVQDTERVDNVCNALLSSMLPPAISSIVLLALLAYVSWKLALIGALSLPLVWLLSRGARTRLQDEVARFQTGFDVFSKGVSFVLRQIELTRVQSFEMNELDRQSRTLKALGSSGVRMSMAYALHGQLQLTIAGVAGVALLVLGGIEVIEGRMSLGSLAEFYFGAGMLYGFVGTYLGGAAEVAGGRQALANVAELLDSEMPALYGGNERIAFTGRFSLEGVSFAYRAASILEAVSLEIPSGAHVAIIGANGSGKTTLLNILLGLVRPTTGRALADGHAYDSIDLQDLRRKIGVVVQRPSFFHGTISENITYGIPEASEIDIVRAVRLAGAEEVIAALPDGYGTIVGQSGVTLSGGGCQRLAIARALLRRPKALILDEPTNHLDVAAVRELLQTLRRLEEQPTILLVSHDTRILEFAERTYMLENGRLAELQVTCLAPAARISGAH
jgi:ABC-type bacteriocin/lantibiotic exporter with double-glycine peptidase domain